MQVTYTNTFSDVYIGQLKDYYRKPVNIVIALFVIIWASSNGFHIQTILDTPASFMWSFILWCIFWFCIIVLISFLMVGWTLTRGKTEGIYGPHVIKIEGDKLVEDTKVNHAEFSRDSIGKVYYDRDYTIIYIGPSNFYIIPNHAFDSGDHYLQFKTALDNFRSNKH